MAILRSPGLAASNPVAVRTWKRVWATFYFCTEKYLFSTPDFSGCQPFWTPSVESKSKRNWAKLYLSLFRNMCTFYASHFCVSKTDFVYFGMMRPTRSTPTIFDAICWTQVQEKLGRTLLEFVSQHVHIRCKPLLCRQTDFVYFGMMRPDRSTPTNQLQFREVWSAHCVPCRQLILLLC